MFAIIPKEASAIVLEGQLVQFLRPFSPSVVAESENCSINEREFEGWSFSDLRRGSIS